MRITRTALSVLRVVVLFICVLATMNIYGQENTRAYPGLDSNVFIKDTDVSVSLPAHFRPYEDANTFIHPGTASIIQLVHIPDNGFDQVLAGLTPEHFVSQGVMLLSEEDVITVNGVKAKIFLVSFDAPNLEEPGSSTPYERIMFFTGDEKKTIWINANYPIETKELLFDVLKESCLSVKF